MPLVCLGQLLWQRTLEAPDGTLDLSIEAQPAGIYYLQLNNNGKTTGRQLIKQ